MSEEKKSVVVADDSPVVRSLLKHIIEGSELFTVVGQAANGSEAVALVKQMRPAVVTMDVQMPKMDGPQAIKEIMRECPTPIVLCSVLAVEGAPVVLDALSFGAFDFITKPKSVLADTSRFGAELIEKLKAALSANSESLASPTPDTRPPEITLPAATFAGASTEIVVFGASTGGPRTLLQILPSLPKTFPACVVIGLQDTPAPILKLLADQFRKLCRVPVDLVTSECGLEPGKILLLTGEFHSMVVRGAERGPRVKLLERVAVSEQTPSLNGLLSSVAVACPGRAIGVLLTGTGKDGALGMKKIHQSGGKTIAEDKRTAVIFEKPAAAIAMQVVDLVLPSYKIMEGILSLIGTSGAPAEPQSASTS